MNKDNLNEYMGMLAESVTKVPVSDPDFTVLVHKKPSKSGKGIVFFPTINGVRLDKTNFRAKWEAVKIVKAYVDKTPKETLLKAINNFKKKNPDKVIK